MGPAVPNPAPPVARRRARTRRRTAVAVGVAGVLAGLGLVTTLALVGDDSTNQIELRLGDDEFHAGRTERLAAEIAEAGPFLVADASPRKDRDIYVQHLGGDPDEGWLAFAARAPGADRECFLEWRPDGGHFVDRCSGRRWPADGEGLPSYPTRVEEGVLYVDLRER